MVVLYVGYVINYWAAAGTRRVEVVALTAMAVALAVFCVTTERLRLGIGAEAGVVISAALAVPTSSLRHDGDPTTLTADASCRTGPE